jgi:hypothetical protein
MALEQLQVADKTDDEGAELEDPATLVTLYNMVATHEPNRKGRSPS